MHTCHSSLLLHIRRCNYHVANWRRSLDPHHDLSYLILHGWVQGAEGLEFQWIHPEMIPGDLVSLLDPNHINIGADGIEAEELEPPALIHEYDNFHEPEDSNDTF